MEQLNLILSAYGIEIHCNNCENINKNSQNRKKKIKKIDKKSVNKGKNCQKKKSFEKENNPLFYNNKIKPFQKMEKSPLNEKTNQIDLNQNKFNKIDIQNIFLKTPQKKNKFFSDFELSDFTPIKSNKKNENCSKRLDFDYSTANKCNFDLFDEDKEKDDYYGAIEKIEGFNFLEEEDYKERFELKKILNFENISQSQDSLSLKKEFPDF